MVTQTYEDGDTVTYKYDNNGALATVIDSATGVSTKYYYDFTERLMKYVESSENDSHSVAYTYDLMNNLTGVVETINGTEFTSTYGYNKDNVLTSVTNGSQTWSFGYDTYGRLNTINGGPFNRTYNYQNVSDTQLSAQLSSISYPSSLTGQTYSYTYDDNGNILTASFGSDTFSYVYDSQNQLIRENNSRLGVTYTWSYDNAGNILSRSAYAYTTGELGSPTSVIQYSYGDSSWGDLVTQIGSNAITYDEIGNMLTFGARSFTWEHGRQLASQTINGSTWTYTYNADGMRTGRTNGTNSYEYIYNGSQLMRMVRNGVTVDFSYINGIPATITFNGNTFYYIVNGQGDVTGITDSQGNLQISYYYDAWGTPYYIYATGNTYGSTLLTINPIMYRSYVFDRELGMYYLQSRYYIPQIARFLNADGYTSTGQGLIGNNMFAYCLNNPVAYSDPAGCRAMLCWGIPTIVKALKKAVETIVMKVQLDKMGFKDITLASAKECVETLERFDINTPQEKAHFFAQCRVEGGLSVLEAGYLSEERAEEYRRSKRYYPYYGAGYIQLTWDYNYKDFSEYMGDPDILKLGPKYVAKNYAWAAAGWFWQKNNINQLIADGATVRNVTRIVNGGYSQLAEREQYYNLFLPLFGG